MTFIEMFIEQVLKEGWEEGRVEGVLSVAKTMLENGFTIEEIKTATKLSKRKIQALTRV
jgi:predicted transposase/invertase (TIGR01784 family)